MGLQGPTHVNISQAADFSNMGGTLESCILIGFAIINHPFWGNPNIFLSLLQPLGPVKRTVSGVAEGNIRPQDMQRMVGEKGIELGDSQQPQWGDGSDADFIVGQKLTGAKRGEWGNDPFHNY